MSMHSRFSIRVTSRVEQNADAIALLFSEKARATFFARVEPWGIFIEPCEDIKWYDHKDDIAAISREIRDAFFMVLVQPEPGLVNRPENRPHVLWANAGDVRAHYGIDLFDIASRIEVFA